jgi:hypothetical protein
LAARGSVDGGGSNPSGARARGKTGEVVAAEEERERTAGAKKRWGGLGVRVDRATASAPPADLMRVDLIQARRPSRRKGGSGAGQGSGLGCGARARGVRQSGATGSGRAAGRRGRKIEEGVGHWKKEERGKEALMRGATWPERERGRGERRARAGKRR